MIQLEAREGLAEVLDALPDPRSRRGRRYRLGPLLALSLLAVLGGATSLAKIARFIAGYSPDLRAVPVCPARYAWPPAPWDGCSPAWRVTPSTQRPATIWPRSSPAPRPPPQVTGPQTAPLSGLAVDGKTLRGSRTGDGTVHLLAATRHDTQAVLAQRQIEANGNEIPPSHPCCPGST
ncbi:transposase family protein [Nonomuraea spiralis]|uniref:transposase family protein n=1 Tax=Nonomuraea spiralis TaxID=46182 RepID=UPI00379F64EB